jgi:dTDP-4-dehydrorhamnose reductase
VVNCAGLTNVDWCEDHLAEAFAVNATGAAHVARAAEAVGAAVVYISSDYVFGAAGPRDEPYSEDDRPGPVNGYGVSKLAGEHLTQAYNARALVVRTCGLYGHAGARGKAGTERGRGSGNFVETLLRLAGERTTIRVVDDQCVSPTSTAACAARLAALIERRACGLYHVAAPDCCTWYELAQALFAHEGRDVDLRPISSAEYAARARRPAWSALRSVRLERAGVPLCPPWQAMLHEYLRTRAARCQPVGS